MECPVCLFTKDQILISFPFSKKKAVFCKFCTCIYPPSKKSYIDELFDSNSSYTWAKDSFNSDSLREKKVIEKTLNLRKILASINGQIDNIIDFGCGPGITLEAAKSLNIKAKGFESDKANADFCLSLNFDVINEDFLKFTNFEKKTITNSIFIFENSLVYNNNIILILKKLDTLSLQNCYIYVEDQCYLFSSRFPFSVLFSSKTSFISSNLTFQLLAQHLNWKTIYSINHFGYLKFLAQIDLDSSELTSKPNPLFRSLLFLYSYFLNLHSSCISKILLNLSSFFKYFR